MVTLVDSQVLSNFIESVHSCCSVDPLQDNQNKTLSNQLLGLLWEISESQQFELLIAVNRSTVSTKKKKKIPWIFITDRRSPVCGVKTCKIMDNNIIIHGSGE